jgi:hypothetical protein
VSLLNPPSLISPGRSVNAKKRERENASVTDAPVNSNKAPTATFFHQEEINQAIKTNKKTNLPPIRSLYQCERRTARARRTAEITARRPTVPSSPLTGDRPGRQSGKPRCPGQLRHPQDSLGPDFPLKPPAKPLHPPVFRPPATIQLVASGRPDYIRARRRSLADQDSNPLASLHSHSHRKAQAASSSRVRRSATGPRRCRLTAWPSAHAPRWRRRPPPRAAGGAACPRRRWRWRRAPA